MLYRESRSSYVARRTRENNTLLGWVYGKVMTSPPTCSCKPVDTSHGEQRTYI